jgi:hypothetical protein
MNKVSISTGADLNCRRPAAITQVDIESLQDMYVTGNLQSTLFTQPVL